jgi:Uncharacterized conserved protein
MVDTQEQFTIKISQFEGPFDLLLFFIERDEIDIMDIPIAKITKDFLAYIRTLERMNIDIASEFILVAATLMRIKAKMLLPRPELDSEGQEIDPRKELAQKLIEYKRFKDILDDFRGLESHRDQISSRGNARKEIRSIAEKALVDIELESLTLYALFKNFERVMNQMKIRNTRPKHLVFKYDYTVAEQKLYLLSRIKKESRSSFEQIFEGLRDRMHAIITFLSLLEMINATEITIVAGDKINEFWLHAA